MNKLPSDLCLMLSRELTGDTWDITVVLSTIEREVRIRERSLPTSGLDSHPARKSNTLATASTLLTNSRVNMLVYCSQEHVCSFCPRVTNVSARREIL